MSNLQKLSLIREGVPLEPDKITLPDAKITRWQRFQCRLFCPNFEEDKPKEDEKGSWTAVAIINTLFLGSWEHSMVCGITSLHRAYEVARWLALKADRETFQDHGIAWAVRADKNPDEKRIWTCPAA